jgi:hypothetical protein
LSNHGAAQIRIPIATITETAVPDPYDIIFGLVQQRAIESTDAAGPKARQRSSAEMRYIFEHGVGRGQGRVSAGRIAGVEELRDELGADNPSSGGRSVAEIDAPVGRFGQYVGAIAKVYQWCGVWWPTLNLVREESNGKTSPDPFIVDA